jgi:hypothetical protein
MRLSFCRRCVAAYVTGSSEAEESHVYGMIRG